MDQPLILKPKAEHGYNTFYFPNNGDKITFSQQQKVEFACPGSGVSLGSHAKSEVARAKCTSGKFKIGRKSYKFDSISCERAPRHTARYTGADCLKKHKEIEIGFVVGKRFFRKILVCLDQKEKATLYSEFNVSKSLEDSGAKYKRPTFVQSHFYNSKGINLNKLYTKKSQRVTINKLLGLKATSQKYVSDKGNQYIARGHLAAKTDFLYGPEQSMTFYLINTAPQWQPFNDGNWLRLESDVRKFAHKMRSDLIVYTGTYGIATLPHEHTGKDVELYLYVNGSTKYFPVPRLFWKVIYEPKSEMAAAFIGVNNPFNLDEEKDIICEDTCDKYKWLTWKPDLVKRGYSYCCSVSDFRKVVKFPYHKIDHLLRANSRIHSGNEMYWPLFSVFFLK